MEEDDLRVAYEYGLKKKVKPRGRLQEEYKRKKGQASV
jgi:hypothetical protein